MATEKKKMPSFANFLNQLQTNLSIVGLMLYELPCFVTEIGELIRNNGYNLC